MVQMEDHRKRRRPPRRPVGDAQNRQQARRPVEGAAPGAQVGEDGFSYDDFVRAVESQDKILDIEDDDRLEKFASKAADISDKLGRFTKSSSKTASRITKNAVKLVDLRLEERVREAEEGRQTEKPQPQQRPKSRVPTTQPKQVATKPQQLPDESFFDSLLEQLKLPGAQRMIGALSGVIVLLAIGGIFVGEPSSPAVSDEGDEVLGASESTFEPVEEDELDFGILQPEVESTHENSGIAFDPAVGVASFQDYVGSHTVTISQQPLNDEQKADPQTFLDEVAVGLFTQGSFESNKGTVHYTVPLPDVDPSQTVVFTHNDLLIFLRTQGVSLNPDTWKRYIDGLN